MAFWRPKKQLANYSSAMSASLQEDPQDEGQVLTKKLSPLMIGATSTMLMLTLSLTAFAGPIFDYTARAAADIQNPSTYIDAVFPNGTS